MYKSSNNGNLPICFGAKLTTLTSNALVDPFDVVAKDIFGISAEHAVITLESPAR